jgi:hypothetical protein
MEDEPKDDFLELLLQRREELLGRYRHHREAAAARILDASKYDRSVPAFFAAGEAAMEQALCDGLFDYRCHAWLAAVHVVFLGTAMNDFSEQKCDFQVTPPPSSPAGTVVPRGEYLRAFAESQDEVAHCLGTIKGIYCSLREIYAACPYRLVNAALLSFAAGKGRIAGHTAHFLERYFAVMFRFVEVEEFGLVEIANYLDRALKRESWN